MNSSNTDLTTDTSSLVPAELFCPPIQTWVISDTTLFKITAAVTVIIFPVTILLNILVIMAVKGRKDLQKNNSNILLASMAVAGVLVGAVSMPLTIILDVLVLTKIPNAGIFCGIAFVNDMVLYIGSVSSVYHLTVIAWERYVAIAKWEDYKVIVTRGRVKKFARIAWLLAVLLPIPPSIMKIASVEYKYLLVVDIACVFPGTVCLMLLGYFYIRVYFGVRRWETEKIREVPCLINAKLATKVAKTTAILTVVVLISFIPSLVFLLFGEIFPALRRSSFFRWSKMLAQLNSVFDPVLYCYRDRRFRDAFLEILKLKNPAPSTQGKSSKDGFVHTLDDLQGMHRVPRSKSYNFITDRSNNDDQRPGGETTRMRQMTVEKTEINTAMCLMIISKGSGTERGVIVKESQSHLEGNIDLHPLKHQASLQNRDSSLHDQSAQGSRQPVRKKVRSNSLQDEQLFVEKFGSQLGK